MQAEFSYKVKPKLPAQFKAAEQNGVPFAVIVGEDEMARGEVKLKQLGLPENHPEKEGVTVKLENLAVEVNKRISSLHETSISLDSDIASLSVESV